MVTISPSSILFLGQNYPLTIVEDLPKAVVMGDSLMISSLVLRNAQDHLECWYKTRALEHLTQTADHYARFAGVSYTSIRLSNAVTRWGSCGYNNTLNFSWKLIMAPARVVDYVVIHELMHIKQKNHSRKFWAEVANLCPDYKQDESWLKKNGHVLRMPLEGGRLNA